MNNLPSLDDLNVFCTVARCGSFAGAAAELGASPAYVSKRIAQLESRLDVRLFHRTTRRVYISDEGEAVFERARKLLEEASAMTASIGESKKEPAGALRVATSMRLGRQHVCPALSLLQQRYPKLEIWLELLDRRVDQIAEGFDIDICVGAPTQPHLIAHRLLESRRILCAAPSYLARRGAPAALAELVQHECLPFRDREQAFGVWRLEGPRGMETIKVRGHLGSNHSDVVRTWGLQGRGIVLLSLWDIAEHLRDGSMVPVLQGYYEPADVWAMSSSRTARSAKVRACIDFLRQELAHGAHALTTHWP